ncbi:HNH endonuclease domain-containing protein [Sporosarcina obsidiansis]|uniref:HNH endonuclease domain-containing protein n=1 Tax=Sporosarcina obsidiansis TaxID=2660748 RepID=UPI00129A89C4|nr:HNH endonuclease domain-containing protein [Sporosarcina obsidiansis]
MTTPTIKQCPRCHEEKPLDQFMYAEKVRSYCRDCERQLDRWRKGRPENRLRTALKDARRTAAKYDAPDTLTLDDLRYLFTLSGGRCAYTGKFTDKPSVEHIIPFSQGGTNSVDNIVIVDTTVNKVKNDEVPAEFLDRFAGFYMTRDIIELVAARRGVDFASVYEEFDEAQREHNNALYRKLTGGDAD